MEQEHNRFSGIRLLLMDCDGVLTDGTVYFLPSDGGSVTETKGFDYRDVASLRWLREAGIDSGIITGRGGMAVQELARSVGMRFLVEGRTEKLTVFEEILEDANLTLEQVAYIGDDITDIPLLRRAGLAVCPANSRPDVRQVAHWVTPDSGGRGAVRRVIEQLLLYHPYWTGTIESRYGPTADNPPVVTCGTEVGRREAWLRRTRFRECRCPESLVEAASRIRLLLMACDGVFSDGTVHFLPAADGSIVETKGFDCHDGIGLKWLQELGIDTGIITSRIGFAVQERARSVGMRYLLEGREDKLAAFEEVLANADLPPERVAYVGTDFTDIPVLRQVGLALCPESSRDAVRRAAQWTLPSQGGRGAVRDAIELLLIAQKRWSEIEARYECPPLRSKPKPPAPPPADTTNKRVSKGWIRKIFGGGS